MIKQASLNTPLSPYHTLLHLPKSNTPMSTRIKGIAISLIMLSGLAAITTLSYMLTQNPLTSQEIIAYSAAIPITSLLTLIALPHLLTFNRSVKTIEEANTLLYILSTPTNKPLAKAGLFGKKVFITASPDETVPDNIKFMVTAYTQSTQSFGVLSQGPSLPEDTTNIIITNKPYNYIPREDEKKYFNNSTVIAV